MTQALDYHRLIIDMVDFEVATGTRAKRIHLNAHQFDSLVVSLIRDGLLSPNQAQRFHRYVQWFLLTQAGYAGFHAPEPTFNGAVLRLTTWPGPHITGSGS